MRQPLLPVALCYAAGVLLGFLFPAPLILLFGGAFTLLIAGMLHEAHRGWWLAGLVILCGWTSFAGRTAILSPHDLRVILQEDSRLVTVQGRLTEPPKLRIQDRDDVQIQRTIATVEVTALATNGSFRPAAGRVLVSTREDLSTNYFAGQNVLISGVIGPPPGPLAPGLFNYRQFLERRGIYYQLLAHRPGDWRPHGDPPTAPPFTDRFLAWAKLTLGRGLPQGDPELPLLYAMVLGWRTGLTDEVSETFMRSGTMHIFAISGLHIALIAGILLTLLRVLQLHRLACGLVVIPLLWFYTAATGWQSSAIRATIMMTILIGGWALKRPSDLLNSLAAAALVVLLWQPEQLFQTSFQLSFSVVLTLALVMPVFETLCNRLLQNDPLQPPSLLPAWRRWQQRPRRWLLTSLATSVAAWLGSLPLTAGYFNLFSPVTLLANLLIVPLAGGALASTLGSLLTGAWFPAVNELLNHSAWFWMTLMMRVSELATTLPGAYWYVASPPGWVFAVYYSLLIGAFGGQLLTLNFRRWLIGLSLLAGLGLGGIDWRQAKSATSITVIPLHGGHAVHVDAPGRARDWLIDCGNTNSYEFVLRPYLRARGVNRLPRFALTHGDLQHVGAALELRREFTPREIITSGVRFRSSAYRRAVAEFIDKPAQHRTVTLGDVIDDWSVLHPKADETHSQADDASLVLLGEQPGARILLLGDLGRLGQEALLNRSTALAAEIVVSGLPTESEPLGQDFLAAIQPRLIIIADSEYPATRQAPRALRERLAVTNKPVLYTRHTGALRLVFRPTGWQVLDAQGRVLFNAIRTE